MNKRKTGSLYERVAGNYLLSQGYEILEYNYRCHMGEIDIIAKEGDYLVFCEVKYRSSGLAGNPLEAVNVHKQHKLSQCALCYVASHPAENMGYRFDVVGILGNQIYLVKHAFELC